MLKTFRYLTISLVVHGMLLALLVFWKRAEPPKLEAPLEIVLVPKPAKSPPPGISTNTARGGDPQAARKATKGARALVAKILNSHSYGLETQSGKASQARPSGSWEEGDFSLKDDPNVAWGAGGGTFERIRDLGLMSYLHAKIDGMLFYPGVLARQKLSGTVNARIVLNQAGACDWKLTKVTAVNHYFRVYVLHLLKKLCDENFKNRLAGRERTNVDVSFQFDITEGDRTKEEVDRQQRVVGNVLLFYRNSHQSLAEWHLGPFTGVFPLPMVFLDFEWVLENFDKYINHKDPLGEYREPSVEVGDYGDSF